MGSWERLVGDEATEAHGSCPKWGAEATGASSGREAEPTWGGSEEGSRVAASPPLGPKECPDHEWSCDLLVHR